MELKEAQAYCKELAQRNAKNFYYAFRFLPVAQQQAAFAIYAFCREADDIADSTALTLDEQIVALDRFENLLNASFEGKRGVYPVFIALHDALKRFPLPQNPFHLLLQGMRDDLTVHRYATMADLEAYCYKVASAVALLLIPVFDPERSEALMPYARSGGIAVQLTNILRDVREDAAMGRIYLPQEDLARFGVSEEAILEGKLDDRFRALMAFEVERARSYYQEADACLIRRDRKRQRVLETARLIYRQVLEEIPRRNFDIFRERVSLSTPRKVRISLGVQIKAMGLAP